MNIYNSLQYFLCAVLWSPAILDNYNCEHKDFLSTYILGF